VYQRPGYTSEISNVTRVTTEVTTEPGRTSRYTVNHDDDPIRIVRPNDVVNKKQNVRIRYLEPPEIQQQAPIVIRERQLTPPPAAPPIIIRQYTKAPPTPPPLVIRERPPMQPQIATQPTFIDKVLPPPTPPPRQVIIERIPEPEKPRDIIYEVTKYSSMKSKSKIKFKLKQKQNFFLNRNGYHTNNQLNDQLLLNVVKSTSVNQIQKMSSLSMKGHVSMLIEKFLKKVFAVLTQPHISHRDHNTVK
jgi:hypothetical protein